MFIGVRNVMYFTTCFGLFGYLQVTRTIYIKTGRELTAQRIKEERDFIYKIIVALCKVVLRNKFVYILVISSSISKI